MTRAFLPYGRQSIDDDDVAAVAVALRSDFLTTGPATSRFEEAFADVVGARHAVAVSSGTAALHVAAMALDLGPDDAIVVPTLTFLATASAPYFTGAEVVFADVDPDTGLLTPEAFLDAISRAKRPVRAVSPVHLNGQCFAAPQISTLAAERGIAVIEDACHSLGGVYRDADARSHRIGACAHSAMTCFSLHPVKLIAMGEGGVVTTNDDGLAERLRRHRNHGMVRDPDAFTQPEDAFDADGAPNPWYYEMPAPGLNYRASDIHCALAHNQLGKLDRFLSRRRELAAQYDRRLASLAPLMRPAGRVGDCESGWHLYVALIDFDRLGWSRAKVMRALASAGVGSQVHYRPVHQQPFWRDRLGAMSLTGAEAYYRRCLSLPLFPEMTDGDVDHVVEALREIVAEAGASEAAKADATGSAA